MSQPKNTQLHATLKPLFRQFTVHLFISDDERAATSRRKVSGSVVVRSRSF